MEKFASTRRANRWQNKGSPLCCLIPEPRAHPLSHLPTLHRTATLVFYRAVILDTDLCTMLCFIHDRVLAPPSDFSDYRTGGSLTEENSLWTCYPFCQVLPRDSQASHTVALPFCSVLRWLRPFTSDLLPSKRGCSSSAPGPGRPGACWGARTSLHARAGAPWWRRRVESSVLSAAWALRAAALTLSTLSSALLGPLFSSRLCLWSPGCGDHRADGAFPAFPGRGTSCLASELKWQLCIEIFGGIFVNCSVSPHKRRRWWCTLHSFVPHLLSTYSCSRRCAEHCSCHGN